MAGDADGDQEGDEVGSSHAPDLDDQIIDAEFVDAQFVDGELVDVGEVELVDEGDVVSGEIVDANDDIDLGTLPPPPLSKDDQVAIERDEFRDALLRMKADFENYKKRTTKEHGERVARAAEDLVSQLLPVLDACEAAVMQGATDVEPIFKSLFDTLTKEGLDVIDDVDSPFDPARHEAVMHEEGDGGEQVVAEALRTGYLWKRRVIRPAMVKVRG